MNFARNGNRDQSGAATSDSHHGITGRVVLLCLAWELTVRILKVTQGERFHFRPQAEWEELLTSLGLRVRALRLDRGYLHPHVLFIAEKPATAA